MGVDSTLVRALGLFGLFVIMLGVGGSVGFAVLTGEYEALVVFAPLLITYSAALGIAWLLLAAYVYLRTRWKKPERV